MKLNVFWYFLLILAVLIISMLFMKKQPNGESFVNYNYNIVANNRCAVSGYPTPNVLKIYDNNYIDTMNGNLLRVYGAAYNPSTSTTPVTNTGTSTSPITSPVDTDIQHLDVINRAGTIEAYTYTNGVPTNKISQQPTSIPNSYKQWTSYPPTDLELVKTTNNQVFYIPWGKNTYVHVIDLDQKTNACGYFIPDNNGTVIYQPYSAVIPLTASAVPDNNVNNNTFVVDSTSSQTMYQLMSNIFYNTKTGDLYGP